MPDYTVKNMKEVDDAAASFGLGEGLEARFAKKALGLSNFGLSYQKLAPEFRMPFGHTHGEQEEVYVVLRGSGRIKLDEESVELSEWDAVRVPAEVPRALE